MSYKRPDSIVACGCTQWSEEDAGDRCDSCDMVIERFRVVSEDRVLAALKDHTARDVLAEALEKIADGTWSGGISSAHGKYLKYLRAFAQSALDRGEAAKKEQPS